ncbi:MAG: AMP-binding protein, partial [Candidatus Marinimicrobia bacterium]|nr:AMP-binding protein [Candidatus Neomarinimicrobiota bacterium]
MSEKVYKPSAVISDHAWIKNLDQYHELYNKSVEDPDAFWAEIAERLTWYKKWDTVQEFDFVEGNIKYFAGGKLNVSYNCLDRHVETGHGDQKALIWEGNDPNDSRSFTYAELLTEVQKFANFLKDIGVEKGDRVCLYMQMIPELSIAMLACTRIGAVHSIVFGAFSSDSLRDR